MKRRDFLKSSLAALAGGFLGMERWFKLLGSTDGVTEGAPPGMPLRKLGRTGFKVSIFSLGGESAVEDRRNIDRAVKIVNEAIDLGVNYIDTAPAYGGGGSEENIGRVMKTRRKEVFLASKTHIRTYGGTMRLIEESLRRLNTDYLDLYQLHNMRTESDLDRVFSSGGAIKALEELKEQGVIKNTGITGHRSPSILLRGINNYEFDCILFSLNAADIHYRPFQKELLQAALEKNMGIIAMKVTARGRIFSPEGINSMKDALGYSLSFPVSTAIVGISNIGQLRENVEIAKKFKPFSNSEKKEIENQTASYEKEGNFFKHYW